MARTWPLRTQVVLLQLAVVGVGVALAGAMAMWVHSRSVVDSHMAELRTIALSVAGLPSVHEAFKTPDPPAGIQQVAELVRRAGDVALVVVTDVAGRRQSHANPALIGTVDPFDPDIPPAGEVWSERLQGVMGEVLRVKVPILGAEGAVIGSASAAQLMSDIHADVWGQVPRLIPWLAAVAVAGIVAARAVSGRVWRQVHRQEPRDIARAVQVRDAVLHAIGDAVVVTDATGTITLFNHEAARLFDLREQDVGRGAGEVLEPNVASVLLPATAEVPDAGPRLALAGERYVVARRWQARLAGKPVGAVLVAQDRTELHEALDTLAGARDQAEALRSQAHEFAGRMHVIAGLLALGDVDGARGFVTGVCLRGAEAEQALAGLDDAPVRALLLAKAAVAAEREVDLTVQVTGGVGSDPGGDLATVVSNLVDNALEAARPGGHVDVELRGLAPRGMVIEGVAMDGTAVEDAGGGVEVIVRDDGSGMAPGVAERAAVAGYSTKGPGRGLGLALVERVAKRRGGELDVTRGPGGVGAVVRVRLGESGVLAGAGRGSRQGTHGATRPDAQWQAQQEAPQGVWV